MPRKRINKIVNSPPFFTLFKPAGIGRKYSNQTRLTLEEYEAFRLADYLGLSHDEAAEEMEISRPTFSRLIEIARKKIAELIIKGNVLIIEGGQVHFRNNIIKCLECEHMFKIGIDQKVTECPNCNSKNILNLAGGFGHGDCCVINI